VKSVDSMQPQTPRLIFCVAAGVLLVGLGAGSSQSRSTAGSQTVAAAGGPASQSDRSLATRLEIADLYTETVGAIPQFGKFEVDFQISGSSATMQQWPFDPAPPQGVPAGVGITVDAVFTSPDGHDFRQPAFYAEHFVDEVRGGRDWHLPTGTFRWRVRFAPHQTGTWTYRIVATDSSGVAETRPERFLVTAGDSQGFIRVSRADPRYFEFSDGRLFTGLGFNFAPPLEDPLTGGTPAFGALATDGINFLRLWISGLYGSAWPPFIGGRNQYVGYLPVTGLVPYRDTATGTTTLAMRLDYESAGDQGWFDACRLQAGDDPESIKPGTFYRIRVEYRGEGIVGPRDPGIPQYGFVAKLGGLFPACYQPATGTPVTSYGSSTAGWSQIEGSWFSGDRSYLPRLHLALENVTEGVAYVRAVSVREELNGGRFGPEMMIRPSMAYHQFIPEEKAFSLDRVVESAEQNGVYLKLVVMDKDDKLYKKLLDDGNWVTEEDNADGFYGTGRRVNRTRWLQQTWWRYLQARWGYSPNVHSWELANEGDPDSTRHYEFADEFGKFMHCRVFGVEPGTGDGVKCTLDHPNAHMVTTSLWHSFPAKEFWGNAKYPNVDYADLHAYVSTSYAPEAEREAWPRDAARYHLWHSDNVAAWQLGRPVVRGEAGLDAVGEQSETALGLERDRAAIWLHNFLWSGLDGGSLYELYWWNSHIWNETADHRDLYLGVENFLRTVPLNKGGFVEWGGTVGDRNLRVVGQKNVSTGRLHLWVQNLRHTWMNVVNGAPIAPISSELVVPGFLPGAQYTLERWNTHVRGGRIDATEQLTADATGQVRIAVTAVLMDVALKMYPGATE